MKHRLLVEVNEAISISAAMIEAQAISIDLLLNLKRQGVEAEISEMCANKAYGKPGLWSARATVAWK